MLSLTCVLDHPDLENPTALNENKKQIFIPKGFAHGFSVLSETAEISYKCDQFYNKQSEAGIRYNDAKLNIDWQIPAEKALISVKDVQLPDFSPSMTDFTYKQDA